MGMFIGFLNVKREKRRLKAHLFVDKRNMIKVCMEMNVTESCLQLSEHVRSALVPFNKQLRYTKHVSNLIFFQK